MAVQGENFLVAAAENVVVHDRDAEKMRHNFRGAIVVAGDPNDLHLIGQLSQERQHFPMALVQPPKVKRIENVSIQDDPIGDQSAVDDLVEYLTNVLRLAVVRAEVEI